MDISTFVCLVSSHLHEAFQNGFLLFISGPENKAKETIRDHWETNENCASQVVPYLA